MSIFRKKLVSVLLAVSMVGAFSAITVYADELDSTVTDNDYTTDDSGTTDTDISDDVPPVTDDTTDDVTPDDSYQEPDDGYSDDSGDSSNTYIQDGNILDNTDNIDYGTADDQSVYDDNYTDYTTDQSYDDYSMSFDEFERATNYSESVDTDTPVVDMYNSNGSDTQTLDSDDWNDIKLNFDETSADGVGDFSFIKNNTSDENSNFSILFLIFGIVFVATSFILMVYLIATGIRSRKLAKAGGYTTDKKSKRNKKNVTTGETKRTKFSYDTSEIDISGYDDNY